MLHSGRFTVIYDIHNFRQIVQQRTNGDQGRAQGEPSQRTRAEKAGQTHGEQQAAQAKQKGATAPSIRDEHGFRCLR